MPKQALDPLNPAATARVTSVRVGVAGIGTMGLPIAHRLLRAQVPLWVWNRHADKCAPLAAAGACVAQDLDALFHAANLIMLVVLNEAAVDAVLGRGQFDFAERVGERTIVQLGTIDPEFSRALGADILAAGGRYVEAPVSGSRIPAEQGRLLGMLAGEADDIAQVAPLLATFCERTFVCGAVPAALRMKLAVNHYLIGMVSVLAEAVHAARAAGVDVALLRRILDAGAMASDVSRGKLHKLVVGDYSAQASVGDVHAIAKHIARQCRRAEAYAPLIAQCCALYALAERHALGASDMAAVIEAFDIQRQNLSQPTALASTGARA